MIIVISGPLPVKLPIKILPQKIFIAPKDAPWNFRGSPWGQFFNTMITRVDMDEIDLSGTKVPKESATVKDDLFSSSKLIKWIWFNKFKIHLKNVQLNSSNCAYFCKFLLTIEVELSMIKIRSIMPYIKHIFYRSVLFLMKFLIQL